MPNAVLEKMRVIPLSYDLMFKHIFGTIQYKRFTADLLETLFDYEPGKLRNIKILNSVKLDQKTIESKHFELDVLVELPNGSEVNLEMQRIYDENAEIKNTLYVMGKFSENLSVGENYSNISKITQVDFVKSNKLHQSDEVIKRYGILNYNDPNDMILGNLFKIIIVDVDAKAKIPYTKVNKRFELWRQLIGADTESEMNRLAELDPIIKDVVEEMKLFSKKKYVQNYSAKERLIRSQINSAKEEGQLEGSLEKQQEIARTMLQRNMPLNDISEITKLSIEDIQKLKED